MPNIPKKSEKSSEPIMGKSVVSDIYNILKGEEIFSLKEWVPFKWTLLDTFSMQNFENIEEIITFLEENTNQSQNRIQKENLAPETYKTHMIEDIRLACRLSKKYLESKGYHLGNHLRNTEFTSGKSVITYYKKAYKISQSNMNEKMYFCTFLKCFLTFIGVVQYKNFTVDYQNEYINLKNEDFVNEIIDIFNDEEFFKYKKNSHRFGENSASMSGTVESDGMQFSVSAVFDVKSLWSIIEKLNGQEKYDNVDALKDLHRMRIEVANDRDALHIGRILFTKLWGNLSIENVGHFIEENTLQTYIDQIQDENFPNRAKYKEALQKMKTPPVKATSSDTRKEFKLTRSNKWGKNGIEIQIVPRDNVNNMGYSHHDIYRIKRQITEKIRLQGFIRTNGMKKLIAKIFQENAEKNDGKSTIQVTEEQVFTHVMEKLGLIAIRGSHQKDNTNRNNLAYSNHDTLSKYAHNYPNTSANVDAILSIPWGSITTSIQNFSENK